MGVQHFVSKIARANDDISLLLSSILDEVGLENKVARDAVFSISRLCGEIKFYCKEVLNREGGEADEK